MMSRRSTLGCGRWPCFSTGSSRISTNQADRERFVLVNERLDEEFKEEGIKRPTGLRPPSQ
jgi:hypothetical protein